MLLDELKVQERLRLDPPTDYILGADAVADCLRRKIIHFATEATVIGASILTANPSEYTTKLFAISGSCKHEMVENQEHLIRDASEALIKSQKKFNRCLYYIASDGDSRHRRALISIVLQHDLDACQKIYTILQPLNLFDLKCGHNGLTADFDWTHILKHPRNTVLRLTGFYVSGTYITAAVIKSHLMSTGMSSLTVDTLLAPNDKQDVVLMLRLLYAIASLTPAAPSDPPLVQSSRHSLCLLGQFYWHLLNAYLDISLSLHQQLMHLSAAAHLMLTLYNLDKGGFIPVQTYFDTMRMIKNAYFCIAKVQCDNPEGFFYLILLGTDGLEKVFDHCIEDFIST
ncbi:hypothetical protein M413DRAFT_33053 [Hebeloma cylindrosporum]|uniref:Uncharacterized protein n=1 Tax=Hebeloma cylindrosporum TaxID=76867 RepID=A0A0C2X9P0_HEBCY|nr:hypothetical protein M413DRAFT_33053 [Hebeloma cylindrosporum h7]